MTIKTKNINSLDWVITFILILVITTSFFNCTNPQKNQNPQQNNWINFEWVGDSIGNRYFDKLAINVPFTIEGIPHKFNCQFDLGATSTMVYGNSISPYLNMYPDLSDKLDTINKTYQLQGKKIGAFKNINFKLDTVLFKNQELVYFDGFGDELTKDSIHTKTVKHIGTVGPDLFQNKYLIIDFPNHRIAMLDSLSDHYKEKTTFIDARLDNGRIKVPITINGTTRYFMFDTGSSLFPLSVLKKDINLISNSSFAIDTLNISTWGENYDVYGYKISSTISIGGFKIEPQNLSVYESKKEFEYFFEQEDIMGIMGNAFFLNKEIIIDYKNRRFGVVTNVNTVN